MRWLILTAALAALSPVQPPTVGGNVRASLFFDLPIYCEMPAWVQVRFTRPDGTPLPEKTRYPLDPFPANFGDHTFEATRDGKPLPRIPELLPTFSMGPVKGHIAPPNVRRNWFPLHLWYRFETPGTYSIRYVNDAEGVISDWTEIRVHPSTARQRQEWLRTLTANPPRDPGDLLSVYLPSLLAQRDGDTLAILMDYLHHTDGLVAKYAVYSLFAFDDALLRDGLPEILAKKGPTDTLALFLSWKRAAFQPIAPQLVNTLLPFLKSGSPRQIAGSIQSLMFLRGHYSWDEWPDAKARIDDAVLANLDRLLQSQDTSVRMALACFLGGTHTEPARNALWQLAQSENDNAREQALICLTWHADKTDLPRLAQVMNADPTAARSLAYHLNRAYGTEAIPYLVRTLREAGDNRVRFECAKYLSKEGRREAFEYFKNQIDSGGSDKDRIVDFVYEQFGLYAKSVVPAGRTEEAVLKYIESRL